MRFLIPFLLLAASVHAEVGDTFTARVVAVYDGDTITVEAPGHVYKVRLHGIDCPELRQPGGSDARSFTADLALGRTVSVTETDVDRYGRVVAVVTLVWDGRVLNEALLRAGHAWWYEKYAPDATNLQQMQADARRMGMGLWNGSPNPVPPWTWRKLRLPLAPKQPVAKRSAARSERRSQR